MPTQEFYFIKALCFTSKAGKLCHMLSFLSKSRRSKDGKSIYSDVVDLFVTVEQYEAFLFSNEFMDIVELNCTVNGTKAIYSL